MQQPTLGQRILALRQEKGLTQEELVAQCNISVRTIQRIEAGEVTPRSYTVKTILSVLGEDYESFAESNMESGLKKAFFLKIDDDKHATFLTRNLKIAWISGIVYLILGFVELPADTSRILGEGALFPNFVYILIKVCVLASIIVFLRGFILTGNILQNYLLKIVVFILLAFHTAYYALDIASLYIPALTHEAILMIESVSIGIVGILMGIAVLRLHKILGTTATLTGIFEILTYACFALVFTAIAGAVLLIPTLILEIILLYKVADLVQQKMHS
ncbi:helix-turn-helix domain-containing protein [Altibacter sp. HG106]|uniref:helix-turn-helix domain-containing protein n=1 Tax=Altibacter sp. HG106 TaxID=3023937 RepID=UPI002350C0F8|nr:helix-turn-helix transcriptional regulator [Altibacter sp. HG106]